MITYVNGSVYQGDWFEGRRGGIVELFPRGHPGSGTLTSGVKGVYVEDECVTDGILVDITVYVAHRLFSSGVLRSEQETRLSHILSRSVGYLGSSWVNGIR